MRGEKDESGMSDRVRKGERGKSCRGENMRRGKEKCGKNEGGGGGNVCLHERRGRERGRRERR